MFAGLASRRRPQSRPAIQPITSLIKLTPVRCSPARMPMRPVITRPRTQLRRRGLPSPAQLTMHVMRRIHPAGLPRLLTIRSRSTPRSRRPQLALRHAAKQLQPLANPRRHQRFRPHRWSPLPPHHAARALQIPSKPGQLNGSLRCGSIPNGSGCSKAQTNCPPQACRASSDCGRIEC